MRPKSQLRMQLHILKRNQKVQDFLLCYSVKLHETSRFKPYNHGFDQTCIEGLFVASTNSQTSDP